MKRIISFIFAALALSGCVAQIAEPIDEIDLGRCLSPTNISAVVKNGEYVVLNWDKSKAADEYIVEFYDNEALSGSALLTFNIPEEDLPYTAHVAADVLYYIRVKAITSDGSVPESKWSAYGSGVQTSAIKSSLNPELVDRTSTSITMKWTADPEVDHIRITPAVNAGEDYTRFDLSGAAVSAAQAEVTGLKASVRYTLTLHFKSADRGEVVAWTKPDAEGAVVCSDTTAIKQAVADKAAKIKLPYSEKPYVVGELALGGPLTVIGDETADGSKPVLAGRFTIADPSVVPSLSCEGITLSGEAQETMSIQTHVVTVNAAGSMTSMSFVNCDITGYQRGLYYDNKGVSVGSIAFEGCNIYSMGYDGGDSFDIRQTATLTDISFKNCTFSEGFRTFIRIDAKNTVGTFRFENNTVNALATAVQSNNNGIFHIRATTSSFVLKNNLFLNEVGATGVTYCNLFGHSSADIKPTEIAANYFYNCADLFFQQVEADGLFKDYAASNGGALLSEDPCEDSGAGSFYITNSELIEKGIGDPRWYADAPVPEPEDLTQEVTVPVKDWNFADSKTFYKAADKDMVRDGIRFYVQSNPVTFDAAGPIFTSKAVCEGGVPVDCGMSIKVAQAGSVVLSTAAAGDDQAVLIVNVDGKALKAVTAGAENEKITFADFEQGAEHMIYLYGTAPIQITYLQWNDDVEVGDNKLAAPEVVADLDKVAQGEDLTVNYTWEAVAKAGSYDVLQKNDGKITKLSNVSEPAYAFKTKSLAAGDYEVGVVVLPASNDKTRESSDTVWTALSVYEVLKPITAKTEWGADYFTKMIAKWGSGVEVKTAFVADNLGYVPGTSKFKFAVDNADTNPMPRVQTGGAGEAGTKSCMQIMVGGNGTLTLTVRSSGDAGRLVKIAKGTEILDQSYGVPGKNENPGVKAYDITAESGDIINIFGSGAINFYNIVWEPKAAPKIVEKTATFDFTASYSSAINVSDNNLYQYVDGKATQVSSADVELGLYFSPNGKAIKTNKKTCSAESKDYQIISYGGGAAYMFLNTSKSGKLKVTSSIGKTASDGGDCKLGVKIDGVASGSNVDLDYYNLAVAGCGAKVYEWEITNTTGSAQQIQIVKPSGSSSPWIYKVEFVYEEAE